MAFRWYIVHCIIHNFSSDITVFLHSRLIIKSSTSQSKLIVIRWIVYCLKARMTSFSCISTYFFSMCYSQIKNIVGNIVIFLEVTVHRWRNRQNLMWMAKRGFRDKGCLARMRKLKYQQICKHFTIWWSHAYLDNSLATCFILQVLYPPANPSIAAKIHLINSPATLHLPRIPIHRRNPSIAAKVIWSSLWAHHFDKC